jgi:MazG family protein
MSAESLSPDGHDDDRRLLRTNDPFADLVALMARLRTPGTGCPWDLEQSFRTILPYTIEEAYEVADAIEREDLVDLKSELGDLLFQSVFHARMAEEVGAFSIYDVAEAAIEKMVRRHPHVFGDARIEGAQEQVSAWERMKASERSGSRGGALDGVALALPALLRAEKLTRRAARVGFDWPDTEAVLQKLEEEIAELRAALSDAQAGEQEVSEELGDILFVCANLGRKLGLDPENVLRAANAKFERRFSAMERLAEETGPAFSERGLADQEKLWLRVKALERADGP